jgi:hypothetical protein
MAKAHKLKPGSRQFYAATKSRFVSAGRVMLGHGFPQVGPRSDVAEGHHSISEFVLSSDSNSSEEDDATRAIEPSIEVRSESSTAGSTEQLKYMEQKDCCFRKYGRLIPFGFQAFDVVKEWSNFQPAGEAKKARHQAEDIGYVNRFLAHISFQNGDWRTITAESFLNHDTQLRSYLEFGTVVRIHTKIADFLTWAKNRGFIRRRQYDRVLLYLKGCRQSAKKAGERRVVEKLEEESRNLPPVSVVYDFRKSMYVYAVRVKFREQPKLFMYDMACVLLVSCCLNNGSTVSVLSNVRLIDVDQATKFEESGVYHIHVPAPKCKTSLKSKYACLVIDFELFSDLVLYRNTVSNLVQHVDLTSPLFRDRKLEGITPKCVNRMCKRAWEAAGIQYPFSTTLIRKMMIVYLGRGSPIDEELIRQDLCLSRKTADKWSQHLNNSVVDQAM